MVPYWYLLLLSVCILWFTYYVSDIFRELTDHLSGKGLLIRFKARAFRKLLSLYIFSYFPFGFEGRIWDLIVSVPDLCLSFNFSSSSKPKGSGTVSFFSKNRFEINKICIEPKVNFTIIALFLNWKQPFFRLKMS